MSAFICGPDHFKQLAAFAVRRTSYGMNVDPQYLRESPEAAAMVGKADNAIATFYADMLYQENIRSVRARYTNDTWDGLPGPIVKPLHMVLKPRDVALAPTHKLSAVAILKMCDCLEYQSCETDDYRTTPAFKLLDQIRGAAIHALPGYDAAPWDYYAEESKAA